MNCHNAENLLNRYVDGELDRGETEVLEEHIASCSRCREALGQLRALVEQAGSAAPVISPGRDLWPSIRNRIEADTAGPTVSRRETGRPEWTVRALVPMAAAILLVITSVITLRLFSDGLDSLERFTSEWNQGLATLAAMEQQYVGVTEDLFYSISGYGEKLPETAREAIEQNLAIIETAIADSRAAALDNPSDAELQSLLSTVYRQKMELLKWTARISTLM